MLPPSHNASNFLQALCEKIFFSLSASAIFSPVHLWALSLHLSGHCRAKSPSIFICKYLISHSSTTIFHLLWVFLLWKLLVKLSQNFHPLQVKCYEYLSDPFFVKNKDNSLWIFSWTESIRKPLRKINFQRLKKINSSEISWKASSYQQNLLNQEHYLPASVCPVMSIFQFYIFFPQM